MRLLSLPTLWTVALDAMAWLILQPLISWMVVHIPAHFFDPQGKLYRPKPWERGGEIYQTLFRVKYWKGRLPSGGVWLGGFSMKRLASSDAEYLSRWLRETCRAEFAHWFQILVSPLFFLWNPAVAGVIILFYALGANLPCIIVQRYNRPRLMNVLRKVVGRSGQEVEIVRIPF